DAKSLGRVRQAVNALLQRLPGNGTNFDFYIRDDPLPNAFALPGGHVVITKSMLQLADRPEEIAGVVAHEIAHETRKHSFRQVIADLGPFLILKIFLGGGRGTAGALGDGSALLVRQGFSQEYELEADAVGWDSLVAARVNPRGFIDIL